MGNPQIVSTQFGNAAINEAGSPAPKHPVEFWPLLLTFGLSIGGKISNRIFEEFRG